MSRTAAATRAALLSILILLALAATAQTAQDKPPLDDASWSLFQRIFSMVLKDYVEPKTPQDLVLGALKGAASSAGPECAYIPPEDVAAYRAAEAEHAVLPLYITKDTDFAKVIAPFPGQDAAVRPGDGLRFIGARSTYDLTYPQVIVAMRGAEGEKVRCIFIKQESWQSYTVTLSRQAPTPPRWVPLGNGSGALVLPCIEASMPREVANALHAAKGPVVLDLRGCASGDVHAAFRWIGELLGKGLSPARKGPSGVLRDPVSGQGYLAGKAVRILADETTARGGEMLVAALAGTGATLVGKPTFGWAPFSQDFPLENGGLLRLNTAYFLAPGGEPLKGHPIPPTIPLTLPEGAKPEEAYRAVLKAQPPATPPPEKAQAKESAAPSGKATEKSKGGGNGR